jgi:AraC-like DNA-binding protein
MLAGIAHHGVDLKRIEMKANELLFILPNQMHALPDTKTGTNYFKLNFDEYCLSRLPKQYPFLIDPYNNQKIQFTTTAAGRIRSNFEMLQDLLSGPDTDPELILSYLNTLLTEMNTAYFEGGKSIADEKLSIFIQFKLLIENHLTEHLAVTDIAARLGVSATVLYNVVKQYAGISPKVFINNRVILEAKRRLCYSESSIKELAFDLGFNDPEYFSRLFKKITGKTIGSFIGDLSGN